MSVPVAHQQYIEKDSSSNSAMSSLLFLRFLSLSLSFSLLGDCIVDVFRLVIRPTTMIDIAHEQQQQQPLEYGDMKKGYGKGRLRKEEWIDVEQRE